jgi:superfamily II DNA or RNA helicase
VEGLSELHLRHPFRKYQRQILDRVGASGGSDRKHHIVAPPGSGKTTVGLELFRRFGEPAVVDLKTRPRPHLTS